MITPKSKWRLTLLGFIILWAATITVGITDSFRSFAFGLVSVVTVSYSVTYIWHIAVHEKNRRDAHRRAQEYADRMMRSRYGRTH